METLWLWIGFNVLIVGLLVLDLAVFHRRSHAVSIKEASLWSLIWISLALLFNASIFVFKGPDPALQFLTGYLIEKSLSVDNIFIFVLIFTSLSVPAAYQHRILFWGVIGALLMRGLLILLGVALLDTFHWIFYLFGAFLVITGVRMAVQKEKEIHPEKNPLIRFIKRFVPVTDTYENGHFVVKRAGKFIVTPMLLTLVIVEFTDLVFATDSIPAVFAVTQDPFIVYTSNVFAILGLRSLYFVLAGVVEKFHYLKIALAIILVSVGLKMLVASLVEIPTWLSLLFIVLVLSVAILASFLRARKHQHRETASTGKQEHRSL